MPRNMSFYLTTDQIRAGTKTVTRRAGWYDAYPGEIITACVKCMGLKKGEKVEKIRQIRIVSNRREPIDAITSEDVIKEGFPSWTTQQFIHMLCNQLNRSRHAQINRIEFEYLT